MSESADRLRSVVSGAIAERMGTTSQTSSDDTRAWTFVASTFGPGWGAAAVLRLIAGPMGGPLDPASADPADWAAGALSILFFVLPVIVAIVMSRRWGIGLRDWGLRMAPVSALLAAPLVGLALALVATALPILVGISEFEPSGMGEVQRLAEARSIQALELQIELADQPRPLGPKIAGGLLAGLLLGLLFAPVIELPWRGLMLTELSGRGFARAALIPAALAGLWWLPYQLLVGMVGYHGTGAAAVGIVSYALLGVPLAWVRVKTGSILPAGVLAVTVSALSELPRLATAGGTHLELELCALAVVGLLAGAALLWPPRSEGSERLRTLRRCPDV
ncbi:MAG: CPBP family intramembrane glutamic endopeptidase [Armatimonadota bacterium]